MQMISNLSTHHDYIRNRDRRRYRQTGRKAGQEQLHCTPQKKKPAQDQILHCKGLTHDIGL